MAYNNGAKTFSYRRLNELTRRAALVANRSTSSEIIMVGKVVKLDSESGRQLASAVESDWRKRMVFYPGDERAFYQALDGKACDPASAIYDPSCRTIRKTHKEVAYRGYGTYRGWGVEGNDQCESIDAFNAWRCKAAALVPARLIVESMDKVGSGSNSLNLSSSTHTTFLIH